ncbi:hypothetical protein TWF506_003630 [Arthrobotrys conoides]|uniref:Uncharacterized protein n=1 Tax=Arthrobotrys conoides TaxID=74498 RepID=A0AAN8RK03_9PEZI
MTLPIVITRIISSSPLITRLSSTFLGFQRVGAFNRGYNTFSKPLLSSKRSILFFLIGPPILYLTTTFARLLYQYPTTDINRSHPVYKSKDDVRFKQLYGHWFSARVPYESVVRPSSTIERVGDETVVKNEKHKKTPIEIWTSALFCTPTLGLEAIGIGFFTGNGFTTGDIGEEKVFVGQELAHGVFNVISIEEQTPPVTLTQQEDGVNGKLLGRAIVAYDLPDYLTHIWEVAAKFGAPWRHISGGRHCFEVIEEDGGRDGEVLVRFGCVIDMERVNRLEREKGEDGKGMPGVYVWLHEVYARWLVDGAVNRLRRSLITSRYLVV